MIFSTCESFQYPKSFGFWITFIYLFWENRLCATVHTGRSQDNLSKSLLSFCHEGPTDQNPVIRLGGGRPFPLRHLTGPHLASWNFDAHLAQFTGNNLNGKINLFSLSDKDNNAIHRSSSSPLDLLCVVWADQRHPQNSEHHSCYFFSSCLTLIGEGTSGNYAGNGSWCLRRAAGQRSSVESTYSLPLGGWWQRPSGF